MIDIILVCLSIRCSDIGLTRDSSGATAVTLLVESGGISSLEYYSSLLVGVADGRRLGEFIVWINVFLTATTKVGYSGETHSWTTKTSKNANIQVGQLCNDDTSAMSKLVSLQDRITSQFVFQD